MRRILPFTLLLAYLVSISSCNQTTPDLNNKDVIAATVSTLPDPTSDTTSTNTIDTIIDLAHDMSIEYDYDTSQWMELGMQTHGIYLDLRYATANNFMKQQIYDCGRCFYRKKVAQALLKVQATLAKDSLALKMYDCYRPAPYQQRLWDILPDARYVARPSKGSLHSRGAAADLTIVDLEGKELDMGTPYDFFGIEAYTTTTNLPKTVMNNRALLQKVMRENGFGTIRTEWWHFNYLGPRLPLSDWLWSCQ